LKVYSTFSGRRFLVQFLDDQSPEVCAAWDGVQVRDHAPAG
jgi:hypothetical protein